MITLASDFGSPYPAAMRGVVRRRCDAELLDVSHELPRGDPRAAAFWLRFVLPEFPPAVHCAVVDPGVGTDRAAIAVLAGDHVVIAPDNGLALPPARELAGSADDDGDEPALEVFEIHVDEPASTTFHGRDVFAPAAATIHEALGGAPASTAALSEIPTLSPTDDYVERSLPEPAVNRRDAPERDVQEIAGEVLVVDDFGNAITNVPGDLVRGFDRLEVNGEPTPVVETFAGVPSGERLVTVGSHGYAECDVNDGRGDEAFGLAVGDEVRFVPDG